MATPIEQKNVVKLMEPPLQEGEELDQALTQLAEEQVTPPFLGQEPDEEEDELEDEDDADDDDEDEDDDDDEDEDEDEDEDDEEEDDDEEKDDDK